MSVARGGWPAAWHAGSVTKSEITMPSFSHVCRRRRAIDSHPLLMPAYAVVTCEMKLFQNYFSLFRRPSEISLFRLVETCLKLFQNYFAGLLQLVNIFIFVA